jgi:hypothetical protein
MVGSAKEGPSFAQFSLLSRRAILRELWTQCGLRCLGVKDDIMKNHKEKQKSQEVKTQDFMGKINFFFWHLASQLLGKFSHMATKISSKNTGKMKIQPILNKNSS